MGNPASALPDAASIFLLVILYYNDGVFVLFCFVLRLEKGQIESRRSLFERERKERRSHSNEKKTTTRQERT